MYDSAITRKENASKDWNCIMSMFLTSFNVYFVFGYACFICVCLKTAIRIFLAFFGEDRLATLVEYQIRSMLIQFSQLFVRLDFYSSRVTLNTKLTHTNTKLLKDLGSHKLEAQVLSKLCSNETACQKLLHELFFGLICKGRVNKPM